VCRPKGMFGSDEGPLQVINEVDGKYVLTESNLGVITEAQRLRLLEGEEVRICAGDGAWRDCSLVLCW